jgi:AraC-like DNA-binding protein
MQPATSFNKTLFADASGNALRCSQVMTYRGEVAVPALALKFVLKGREHYRLNGRDFAVQSGQFLLTNNRQTEAVAVTVNEEAVGVCIDFSEAWVYQLAALAGMEQEAEDLLGRPHASALLSVQHFGLESWLQQANYTYFSKHNAAAADHARQLWELGALVIPDVLQWQRHFAATGGSCHATREARLKVIWQAKRLLDQQPNRAWKLEQLAKEAGMSKFHLLRQFKQVFGLPPHQYLLQKRLHWAKNQLSGSAALSELALEAGFADLAAFSKAFKKQFGESPSNVRQSRNF